MLELTESASVEKFTQHTAAMIKPLEETARPKVLTVDGKPVVIVQDGESYQHLLDRLEAIEGIRQGLDEAARGEGRSVEEVFSELRVRHSLPGR